MKALSRPFRSGYRATLARIVLPTFVVATLAIPMTAPASTTKPNAGHKKTKKVAKKQGRDLSKGNTMYVVPYAHLDTQWRWAYPQVIKEFIANTLNRNFDLIDKYPNYVFNFSGSRRYEMMKEYYPAEYTRLKDYIKQGRWFPCGSSVDEGDANVPSAESLVRHVLYGNHYFKKEFGIASEEFMLPDCFGFPYALPSILNYCGVKGFSTQKLTWGSSAGIPFKVGTWEGPDGKSIIAALDPGSYGGDVREDLSQNTSWLARIQNTGKQSGAYVDYHYYGTGDRGGAPNGQSVDWVEKSIKGTGPITVVSSKADQMFKDLTPGQVQKLPHYKGELLLTQHSAGSISSQAYMKRWNRKSELLADAAEKASVAAAWLGTVPYPSERLYSGWDLVLGSQMHDMLPGTSIPKAYEFCWNDFNLAQNTFAAVEKDAVGAVTASMDTRGSGIPLVVYNPLATAREDVVDASVAGSGDSVSVVGPDGRTVPSQVQSHDGKTIKFIFLAKVPSAGFASYQVKTGSAAASSNGLKVSESGLENDRFKVTLNADGDIASIYDKANRREVLKAPARLEMQYHNPSQYPAWNMDWDDAKLPPRDIVHGPAKVRIVENGPVRVAIAVERETAGSKFVQTIRLSKGSNRVEVVANIDWQTKERALKASFPLTCGGPEATYDLQLGAVKRGNAEPKKYEVPQHQWLDLSTPDNSYGAGILNDGKFASDKPNDDTVRLTLLYTPGVRAGFNDQATQDFGKHEILYAIAPHAGSWQKGNVAWEAKRLNQPLRSFLVPSHPGRLGKQFSIVSANSGQVEISALKKAEDSNEIVVRLRELTGSDAKGVRVNFLGGIQAAREVNGQEAEIGSARVNDGALVTDVPGFSLRSFAVTPVSSSTKVTKTESTSVALPYDQDVVSSIVNPADGDFAKGLSYSAEQFPAKLDVDNVHFNLGPTEDGAKNAVAAAGQTIQLPAGYSKVYVLAAADGDVPATFSLDGKEVKRTVQDWNGYIGQWDNRVWSATQDANYNNYGEMTGLTPGYVKPSEVAWYCSHRHDAKAGNTYYDYSYLFKYGFDVPAGAHSITLPNDSRIRVFAISVAKDGHDTVMPAAPLHDTLADHRDATAPMISPSSGIMSDATYVTITAPIYHQPGGLRYTLDGQEPSASSPLVKGPILVTDPTTIKVAEFGLDGTKGPSTTANLEVHDTTPPHVTQALATKSLGFLRLKFSEPVTRESAENVANYKLASGAQVTAAHLTPDGCGAELTIDHPAAASSTDSITVSGIQDQSHSHNTLTATTTSLEDREALFTSPAVPTGTGKMFRVDNLPIKAAQSWTLNMFCKIDTMPEDRTMIAGFGRSTDGEEGTGRYFTKFNKGINFWITGRDVETTVPLDLGKWQMLTATYDGTTVRVYKNGELIGSQAEALEDDASRVNVMPLDAWERKRRFGGDVKDLTIWNQDLAPDAVKKLWAMSQH